MRKETVNTGPLTWVEKLMIVSEYRRHGNLSTDVCRKIGKKLKRDSHYILTCKNRKWFREFVEIWDFVQTVRIRERKETIKDYEEKL